MNKELVLSLLLEDAEKNKDVYLNEARSQTDSEALLREDLQTLGRGQIDLPSSLPSTPGRMISRLRSHFKDNVTLISRVLNHHFPDQYLFYRVSDLEEEIFTGFDYFSSLVPEFDFEFSRVGRRGFDNYLAVNEALLSCFKHWFPDVGDTRTRISWFLYEGLGRIFLEKSDYNRYWVQVTGKDYFEILDSGDDLEWSGRKEMQVSDLVFIYRTTPRKAITDIFEVTDELPFDPWGKWNGFSVDIRRVCQIEDIPFANLKNDPVIGKWGAVRKQFRGVVVESVSHTVYNRLLEKIPGDLRMRHHLNPEPTASEGRSGEFRSEADFEDQVIEPLLRRWSFGFDRQHRCRFFAGSESRVGRVDFFVSDSKGPITLFENKFKIIDDKKSAQAMEQGKSYALMLGLPSFVVASPEGIWIYSLHRNKETLQERISLDELDDREEDVRRTLLRLRSG